MLQHRLANRVRREVEIHSRLKHPSILEVSYIVRCLSESLQFFLKIVYRSSAYIFLFTVSIFKLKQK